MHAGCGSASTSKLHNQRRSCLWLTTQETKLISSASNIVQSFPIISPTSCDRATQIANEPTISAIASNRDHFIDPVTHILHATQVANELTTALIHLTRTDRRCIALCTADPSCSSVAVTNSHFSGSYCFAPEEDCPNPSGQCADGCVNWDTCVS